MFATSADYGLDPVWEASADFGLNDPKTDKVSAVLYCQGMQVGPAAGSNLVKCFLLLLLSRLITLRLHPYRLAVRGLERFLLEMFRWSGTLLEIRPNVLRGILIARHMVQIGDECTFLLDKLIKGKATYKGLIVPGGKVDMLFTAETFGLEKAEEASDDFMDFL